MASEKVRAALRPTVARMVADTQDTRRKVERTHTPEGLLRASKLVEQAPEAVIPALRADLVALLGVDYDDLQAAIDAILAAAATYVDVAGDTMTGALAIEETATTAFRVSTDAGVVRVIVVDSNGKVLKVLNATDIRVYSDDGSTEVFTVDGATGDVTATAVTASGATVVNKTATTAFRISTDAAATSILTVDTSNKVAKLRNATDLEVYSDNGSTLVAKIDGATGDATIGGALDHDGSTVGFYGTSPASKPTVTGSRGGNAALASLLTALANLGLITNSSSA